jgi:serine protease AprX
MADHTILCYGLFSLDNIVRVPAMPTPDRGTHVTADYYKLGGEALNVGVALSGWGLQVAAVGNDIGEDPYADFIVRELERYPALVAPWLVRNPRVRTPFRRSFVTPDGRRHIVSYWSDEAPFPEPKREMLPPTGVVSIDSQGGKRRIQMAQVAREAGLAVIATTVLWPADPVVPLCNAIIISRALLRAQNPDVTPQEHAAALRERGAGVIIITTGMGPVEVFTQEGEWLAVPPYPLLSVDSTGASDIFKAGVIYGWQQAMPVEGMIRFANAAAALWVATPTAIKRPPTLAEIEALQLERETTTPRPVSPTDSRPVCPICRRITERVLFEQHWHLEANVIQALRDAYPAWRRVEGICPSCVRPHLAALPPIGGPVVEEGHPVYGKAQLGVLPTPARLYANPHFSGRGITICFLDSGFYPHPDLILPKNRIRCLVDATRDPIIEHADFSVPQITSWHGTMTSVVAAGNGQLSEGRYRGIASEAELVLVKISNPRGWVTEENILRGMQWILDNHERYGINVVNLSVGGDYPEGQKRSPLNEAVDAVVARGIAVVAAAGNAGAAELRPPASAKGAITAGGLDDRNALDRSMHRMYNSNWGRTLEGQIKPEIIAPSIWVAAPVLPGTPTAEQNLLLDRLWQANDDELPLLLTTTYQILGFDPAILELPVEGQRYALRRKLIENKVISPFYQHVDGTSFAAPIIASVVAQMLEANPRLRPERVKELLIRTAEPLMGEARERQGNGVVVPGRAVAAALREVHGHLDDEPLSPYADGSMIHFVYHDRRARQVAVIGDFNDWNPRMLAMGASEQGCWHALMPRPAPGEYHYKFLVDGDRWLDDPENGLKAIDGYGGFNSVLMI